LPKILEFALFGRRIFRLKKRKRAILIVDDHPLFRRGIAGLLNQENDLEVRGEAERERECSAAKQIQQMCARPMALTALPSFTGSFYAIVPRPRLVDQNRRAKLSKRTFPCRFHHAIEQ
jgi:hypothetical protein